jgi:hypothetical protein
MAVTVDVLQCLMYDWPHVIWHFKHSCLITISLKFSDAICI